MSGEIEQLSIHTAEAPGQLLAPSFRPRRGMLLETVRRLWRIPTACVSLVIIAAMVALATLSWLDLPLTPYTYDQISSQMLAAPSTEHPMGTDELGRDVLTRVIYGARLSITIGVVTALAALVIGTIYGSLAGFYGGRIDAVLMRGIDIAYSLPELLVMILVGVVIGRGTLGILIAVALVSWMGTARLVRAQIMQLEHEEFIEAALAAGQESAAIICKHLLPNAIGPIIVALTFTVPAAILAESTLSFIGLGLSPPSCSWGTLASEGWRALRTHPHLIFFPSAFIFATVLSLNFLGDGLRDAIDPRTRL